MLELRKIMFLGEIMEKNKYKTPINKSIGIMLFGIISLALILFVPFSFNDENITFGFASMPIFSQNPAIFSSAKTCISSAFNFINVPLSEDQLSQIVSIYQIAQYITLGIFAFNVLSGLLTLFFRCNVLRIIFRVVSVLFGILMIFLFLIYLFLFFGALCQIFNGGYFLDVLTGSGITTYLISAFVCGFAIKKEFLAFTAY